MNVSSFVLVVQLQRFLEDKKTVKMKRISCWFLLFYVLFLCVNDGFTGKLFIYIHLLELF